MRLVILKLPNHHTALHYEPSDLNLGCPQEVARDGHYGAYLLGQKDWPLVENIGTGPYLAQISIDEKPSFCNVTIVHCSRVSKAAALPTTSQNGGLCPTT